LAKGWGVGPVATYEDAVSEKEADGEQNVDTNPNPEDVPDEGRSGV
jgi:hypothetical protein